MYGGKCYLIFKLIIMYYVLKELIWQVKYKNRKLKHKNAKSVNMTNFIYNNGKLDCFVLESLEISVLVDTEQKHYSRRSFASCLIFYLSIL